MDPEICLVLIFQKRVMMLVSTTFFVWFFNKNVSLATFQWPNFIVWLPLLLETLGNTCIEIVCSPGCDVTTFEISLIFLINPFCYRTKKSRQKFKYFENGKSYWGKIKSNFHHFRRDFNCQKLSQTWECAFN